MTISRDLQFVQLRSPSDATPALQRKMTDCWVAVTNAGGAAGFPFPPVDACQVAPTVAEIAATLGADRSRVLLALDAGTLTGWVHLHRSPDRLVAHWGSVHHLQVHPAQQRGGIGSALMQRLHEIACHELGLEQLHLAARGGAGLEDFYTRLGWREVGRWPGKLRLALDDTRDEVLMILDPL